jgi:Rne/Rng family ribonuclease
MSKELVISANRHETKVAILEDDQLVEIYFQRSNEYSLAGSIHKGRVTRVLPGMQSAFVDLGLDRDTFLYVSDFFEENGDDIDRIPDERIARPEPIAEPVPIAPPPVVEEQLPAVMEALPLVEEVVPEPVVAGAPVPGGEPTDDQGGDPRDRRGRRSRRRRNRGRGFPDSKYAAQEAPRPEVERERERDREREPRREPLEAAAAVDDSLFAVLPGESLAKYRQVSEGEAVEPEDLPSASEPDMEEPASANRQAVDDLEPLSNVTGEADEPLPSHIATISDDDAEELPPANAIPDAPLHGEADAPVAERQHAPNIASESAAPAEEDTAPAETGVEHPEVEETGASDLDEVVPEQEDVATLGELDSEDTVERSADEDEDREIQALILEGDTGESEEAAVSGAPETPLTANVREQGSRYMHRVPRRTRRRPRGAANDQQAPPQPPAAPVAPRPEPRVEHRPATRPEKTAMPSITDLLKEGQEILVQIAKEPLGQKGARITSHIALPGRYVVYMPTLDHMGVSRKIASDDERLRLKKILQKARVGLAGGFIIRTAGEGKTEEDIAADMTFLANLWLDIRQKAEKRPAPLLLHHDLDIVQRVLRDQVNDSFKSIWVDSEEVYESILRFMQRFQPTVVSRVKLYTRAAPIFDAFNVTNELEKALRPKVWLKSGGYIVINQTEALVAIDVNTGKYVGKSNRLEDTIVKTNTEAIKEIVRQIRLRDLGGIIVIDFIDMDERKNRQKVMQTLEEAMRLDRAPYKILQFNDFGLVAITRKRVKQSLERTLCSPCPYCEGAGSVKSVQTIIGEILQEAQKIARAVEGQNVMLRVHPDVAKVLKSNENKYLEELEEILKLPVLVTSDAALHHEKFDLA